MSFMKIYDCSNSEFRPLHRDESLGPKQNDVMAALRKYAADYSFEYVDDPSQADVIVTNDVFPPSILALGKPLVKRMDGVFWDNGGERNKLLNEAALQADKVIFISTYSLAAYSVMYGGKLKFAPQVIKNEVDGNVFYEEGLKSKRFMWACAATNWARQEKRLSDIIRFAGMVEKFGHGVNIIGKCDVELPTNMFKHGYQSEDGIRAVLNKSAAFVNLSYRDAAPKTVCQAVSCKLPVLYADSGGVAELVYSGMRIDEPYVLNFEESIPSVSDKCMIDSLNEFMWNFLDLTDKALLYKNSHKVMLADYFDAFRRIHSRINHKLESK